MDSWQALQSGMLALLLCGMCLQPNTRIKVMANIWGVTSIAYFVYAVVAACWLISWLIVPVIIAIIVIYAMALIVL